MSVTIKAWVNGAVQDITVNEITTVVQEPSIEDRIRALESQTITVSSVTLLASSWVGSQSPYSQVVAINGVTANSKIDLQPTAVQLEELQSEDIAFIAENTNGVVTVYAVNAKPAVDYTIQVQLTEVTSV